MITTSSTTFETANAYSPCDECRHTAAAHLNAWDDALTHTPVADFIFGAATCWAENICSICDPINYQVAADMAAEWIELHQ